MARTAGNRNSRRLAPRTRPGLDRVAWRVRARLACGNAGLMPNPSGRYGHSAGQARSIVERLCEALARLPRGDRIDLAFCCALRVRPGSLGVSSASFCIGPPLPRHDRRRETVILSSYPAIPAPSSGNFSVIAYQACRLWPIRNARATGSLSSVNHHDTPQSFREDFDRKCVAVFPGNRRCY
jgi:hypothetical protein